MTSAPTALPTHLIPAATTATSAIVPDAVPCSVCRHDLGAHDAIGNRFCQATQAQALDRSCICRSQN
jgi:hypothetical protein